MKVVLKSFLHFATMLYAFVMFDVMDTRDLPLGLRIFMYAIVSIVYASGYRSMEQKYENEKSALERKKVETSKDIGRLLAAAEIVYKTKDPTNADMRELRKELVTLVISQIKRGESLKDSGLYAIPPLVLRDIVQKALEENVIDLSKDNTPEMTKLLKHAFSTGVSAQGGLISA